MTWCPRCPSSSWASATWPRRCGAARRWARWAGGLRLGLQPGARAPGARIACRSAPSPAAASTSSAPPCLCLTAHSPALPCPHCNPHLRCGCWSWRPTTRWWGCATSLGRTRAATTPCATWASAPPSLTTCSTSARCTRRAPAAAERTVSSRAADAQVGAPTAAGMTSCIGPIASQRAGTGALPPPPLGSHEYVV